MDRDSGRPPRARRFALTAIGVLLLAAVAGFVLLFLAIPKGLSPGPGWAPKMADVWRRMFPFPRQPMTQLGYQRASLALLMTSWTLWGAGLWLVGRAQDAGERVAMGRIVMAVAVIGRLLLILLPPLTSADFIRYLLFGKMIAVHHLNPLVTPATALVGDPMLQFTAWPGHASIYGPPLLWIAALVARLCGGDVVLAAIAFKAVFAAADIGVCLLIRKLVREADAPNEIAAVAIYAWSPVALLESAVGAHTEPLMMAPALAGLLLARRGRHIEAAFALFVLSASVKYLTGTLAVLYFIHAVGAEPDARRRIVRAGRLFAVGAVMLVILYLPFWSPDMLRHAFEHLSGGRHLAPAGEPARPALSPLALGAMALLGVGALGLALRGTLSRIVDASAALMLAFLQLVFQYQFSWYFMAPLALAAPGTRTRLNRVVLVATVVLAIAWMIPYGILFGVPPE